MPSYRDSIEQYFNILSDAFGDAADSARRHGLDAIEAAAEYLADPDKQGDFLNHLGPSTASRIEKFWQQNEDLCLREARTTPGLRARFASDLAPLREHGVLQRAAVYFDTVILPDPLINVLALPAQFRQRPQLFLRFCFGQLLLRDAFLPDAGRPLAILVNDKISRKGLPSMDQLTEAGTLETVALVNRLFDAKLDTFEETEDYFRSLGDLKTAISAARSPDDFFFDESAPRDPLTQIEAVSEVNREDWDTPEIQSRFPGASQLLYQLFGRVCQASDALHMAANVDGHPLMGAPVTVHWLKLFLKSNHALCHEALPQSLEKQLTLTNALLGQRLAWLSNIPFAALLRLRDEGQLKDLRTIISADVETVSNTDPLEWEKVERIVDRNLSVAIQKHRTALSTAMEQARHELGVSGISAVLAGATFALQPTYAQYLPTWLPTMIGVTSLAALAARALSYLRERRRLAQSPVGVLMEAVDDDVRIP